MSRTRAEKARAIAQVAADGPTPLHQLVILAGADERSLLRWARDGRHGCYLDAINRAGSWFTSRQAVARFLSEVARVEEDLEKAAAQRPVEVAASAAAAEARPRTLRGAARFTRRPTSPTAATGDR